MPDFLSLLQSRVGLRHQLLLLLLSDIRKKKKREPADLTMPV